MTADLIVLKVELFPSHLRLNLVLVELQLTAGE